MVFACCAVGCHNRQGQRAGLSFYRFPTDPDKRAKWIAAVKRQDWEPTEYSRLCSDHLISEKANPLDLPFLLFWKKPTHSLRLFSSSGKSQSALPTSSPLSEKAAADVSCEDAQRMQRGYSRRLTDDDGHRTFVARICRGFTSYTAESSSVLKVLCSSKLFARMKSQWTDARWIERMKHVCNEYTTDA
ncbi:peroxynitrite isomerase THAP4-like [Neoarius graeffei]|uniref:peroxynitrite isomerase THAP4-like n=1 Tax=Neoarius graeffei TaxID=443677 RepID=UPI00298CD58D|nr:peroxynitrite isomerase THAP4-like [Neoarius graeffei]